MLLLLKKKTPFVTIDTYPIIHQGCLQVDVGVRTYNLGVENPNQGGSLRNRNGTIRSALWGSKIRGGEPDVHFFVEPKYK